MNKLSIDVGYMSINHEGEELCGDNVELVDRDENYRVIVLADGMGSGVRASILSTLTSKIISTMLAEGMTIENCVETIASTLPVNPDNTAAYSTFTIIQIKNNSLAVLIQYENPDIIMYRDGRNYEYMRNEIWVSDKKILKSTIVLQEGDVLIAMSDGCPHASANRQYNMNWKRSDIMEYMEPLTGVGYSAKVLTSILMGEISKLYGGKPLDDATVCTLRVCRRETVNVLFGPPKERDDCEQMMRKFFNTEGKHVVCGGTTAQIAAQYLGEKVIPINAAFDSKIPPISEIRGCDLVTEGMITMGRVLEYAEEYIADDGHYPEWSTKRDGASLIARLLFEEATDVNFFVGRAVNEAQQELNVPLNIHLKLEVAKRLALSLEQMGKKVSLTYF